MDYIICSYSSNKNFEPLVTDTNDVFTKLIMYYVSR